MNHSKTLSPRQTGLFVLYDKPTVELSDKDIVVCYFHQSIAFFWNYYNYHYYSLVSRQSAKGPFLPLNYCYYVVSRSLVPSSALNYFCIKIKIKKSLRIATNFIWTFFPRILAVPPFSYTPLCPCNCPDEQFLILFKKIIHQTFSNNLCNYTWYYISLKYNGFFREIHF